MREQMKKHDLFSELKLNYDNLTGSQKKIGKYVLDHYEQVAFMSAVELAEAVGVSDATIIRFARNIGFSGYVEFKQYMREGMKVFDSPDSRVSKSLELIENKEDLSAKVGNIDLENLRNFLQNIDLSKIGQAADAIYAAKCIYFVGMGTAATVTQFLQLHLRRMGFQTINVSEAITISPEKIVNIKKEDLLICCGFPRYSKGTYNAIIFAKNKGATVLTITDSDLSALAVYSDIVLSVRLDNITFFNSYIVPMELCNILLMKVLERNGKEIYGRLRENIDCLKVFDMIL